MNEGVWQRRIPRQDKAYDWLETTVTYSNLKMQQNGFRYSQRQQVRVEYHRSRIRYLGKKKSRILTNFPKLKKFVQIRTKIR